MGGSRAGMWGLIDARVHTIHMAKTRGEGERNKKGKKKGDILGSPGQAMRRDMYIKGFKDGKKRET